MYRNMLRFMNRVQVSVVFDTIFFAESMDLNYKLFKSQGLVSLLHTMSITSLLLSLHHFLNYGTKIWDSHGDNFFQLSLHFPVGGLPIHDITPDLWNDRSQWSIFFSTSSIFFIKSLLKQIHFNLCRFASFFLIE